MTFLDALQCKNKSGKVPLWLMRQAGRYLEEYRALRERYDFMELCHKPELIVNVTKMPVDIFGFDAAIVFSDILLIAKHLGLKLEYIEGSGPNIEGDLDIDRLRGRDVQQEYLVEAIKILKRELTVPLIGFVGAPFTVACYLIEGKHNNRMHKTKKWLLEEPKSFHELLSLLAQYSIQQLNAQIDAGVDAIQIFDTWADVLGWREFQEFSLKYLEMILRGVKKCPTILFCRGSSAYANELVQIKPNALSLDWRCDLAHMRKNLGPHIALQGNLDPDILLTNPETVKLQARTLLDRMQDDPGFIFNLGHGIHPETPRKNVEALVSCFKS